MKFPSAVTAMAGNAIRKLHRQSDQAEIIVCGEFIIHVKHDYALRRAETLVSYLGLEWELAQSVPQSSLKKLADAKLNATSSCLRAVSRARVLPHAASSTPYYFALPFLCSTPLLRLLYSNFVLFRSFLRTASSSVAKEKRHYTGRFVEVRP